MMVHYLFDEDFCIYATKGLLSSSQAFLANDWEYVCIPVRWYHCSWKGTTMTMGYRCFMSSEKLGLWRYTTHQEDAKLKSFGLKI